MSGHGMFITRSQLVGFVTPPGRVLVHNNAPPGELLGPDGFRAWTQPAQHGAVLCACGWAPDAGPHFRILYSETSTTTPKENAS